MAGIVLACAGTARADPLADYEHARNDYDAGRYGQAAERFQALIEPGGSAAGDPVLLEQSRIYYAACLIALGRGAESDREIRAILLANPAARPDPVVFPRGVVDRFTDVREKIRAELNAKAIADAKKKRDEEERARAARLAEKARLQQLEALAGQELHVVHNSRWIASLPFGVGQFQNRQPVAGWLLLTGEAALAATTIVTSTLKESYEAQGFDAGVDRPELNRRVSTLKIVNWASFAGFLGLAAFGVGHAHLTYVPEFRTVRQRPLPPPPAVYSPVAPAVGLLPGGGFMGLRGQF